MCWDTKGLARSAFLLGAKTHLAGFRFRPELPLAEELTKHAQTIFQVSACTALSFPDLDLGGLTRLVKVQPLDTDQLSTAFRARQFRRLDAP